MNIDVKVTTGVQVSPDSESVSQCRIFERESIPVESYGSAVVRVHQKGPTKTQVTADEVMMAVLDDSLESDLTDPKRSVVSSYPDTWTKTYGENWLVLSIRIEREGKEEPWLFYYRKDSESPYELVPIPEKWYVDTIGRIHIPIGKNYDIVSHDDERGIYPWLLFNPELYSAFLWLNQFIKAYPSSALYILLHSPQPYKGLGMQVKDGLQEISALFSNGFDRLRK
jgi:hypothetical protein